MEARNIDDPTNYNVSRHAPRNHFPGLSFELILLFAKVRNPHATIFD